MPGVERISEEAARAIWRLAQHLQAEAERRVEERTRRLADTTDERGRGAVRGP